MKFFLYAIFLLSLTTCATSGRDFRSDLNWIQKNKTRQDDVRLVMGAPQAIGSASGTPTWTFGYYKFALFGESQTKEVKFYWNPDGTVNSYSFTSSFPDDLAAVKAGTTPARAPGPAAATAPQPAKPATNKPVSDVSR